LAIVLVYGSNVYLSVTQAHAIPGFTHTWTLSMEEQFYLVWPLILALILRARRRMPLVAAGLAVVGLVEMVLYRLYWNPADASWFNPGLTAGGLILGCSLALARDQWDTIARKQGVGVAGSAVIAIAVVVGSAPGDTTGWADLVANCGAALLIAHLVADQGTGTLVSKAMACRALTYLGSISYEFYLWHFPLLAFVPVLIGKGHVANVLVSLVLTLTAAALTHAVINRYITRRFKPRLVPPTPTPISR
jgi:peptidoglycan/LPS O-acetylase OafA/YrhL